jgi:type I restriction enzyme S subunit
LIVTRSGILQHSLPVAVTAREVAINQDLKALIPFRGIDASFIAVQLRAEARQILNACVKAGTTVESLDFARLKNFPLRIAPTDEQVRIVAKLEPLLARCASVRAELAHVEKLAFRQRRAVLAAAFRGALNRAPRNEDGVLIGWATVPLSSLLSGRPSNGFSPPSARDARGAFSLRLTATTSGELRLDKNAIKRVHIMPPSDSKYWLRPGDLLVQRANALEHVGAAAIFDGEDRKYIYPDLMMRIRIEDELTRQYVWRYLNSPPARRYFQENATGTAGSMPKITGQVLSDLPVPLAPRGQMDQILNGIEQIYARLDTVRRENQRGLRLIDKLEQAFLRKAFDGSLVKQSPEDEPAGSILEDSVSARVLHEGDLRMPIASRHATRPEGVREYVERQLTMWPADGMTFEQLTADAPGTYEELKDLVFELMGSRRLGQRYDGRERKMKLLRRT